MTLQVLSWCMVSAAGLPFRRLFYWARGLAVMARKVRPFRPAPFPGWRLAAGF